MAQKDPSSIRFRGQNEPVVDTIRVRGRTYFALERLSDRDAFRVFDPHAAPGGDYRVLYRFLASEVNQQRMEVLRRLAGPNANRNFPLLVESVRNGSDYIVVLSWVWGTNLQGYLRAIRENRALRPSAPEVVRLVRGLVHGVGHFHRRMNMIHGDISPANIVLTSGTKQLVLVDFGSAWPVEESATNGTGDGVTQPYAAPERLAKHASEDFRSDQFSLSAVAYELLTLAIPFDGLGGQAGLPHLIDKSASSFRPPSELLDGAKLPRESLRQLDECIRTGLALHPDGRHGTRTDWLSAWDSVHESLKKGERLTAWERSAVGVFEFIGSLFKRRDS